MQGVDVAKKLGVIKDKPIKENDRQFLERLFLNQFDLIGRLQETVYKLENKITGLAEQLLARPCIIDENVSIAEELTERCNACALTRLDATNKRLMGVIFWGIVMLFMGITGTLAGLGIYVAQHEEVIMKALTIWGGMK